jgi:hypothetical protein
MSRIPGFVQYSRAEGIKMNMKIDPRGGGVRTHTTGLYINNLATILMANAVNPTERSRHINVQLFALLSWFNQG